MREYIHQDVANNNYYPLTSAVPAVPLLNRLTSFDPTASGPPSYIAEGGVCSEEDCHAPCFSHQYIIVETLTFLLTMRLWKIGSVSKTGFLLTDGL